MIRTIQATRYITPLREGGSLPAIVEASDGELYVMKFVGAGHGEKALTAELIAGEIARALGLRVPEIVLIEFDPALGRNEAHPEIRELLKASAGLNLGLRYLAHAFEFNMLLAPPPASDLAAAIVWFDAYVTNVDRTPRNTNMLIWQDNLWLIDHGSALYFHHNWDGYLQRSRAAFQLIKDHTLLSLAEGLREIDVTLKPRLTPELIQHIVDLVPDAWLHNGGSFDSPAAYRAAYVAYLLSRLAASHIFVEEALYARAQLV